MSWRDSVGTSASLDRRTSATSDAEAQPKSTNPKRGRDPNRPDDRLTGADIRLISGSRSDRMSSHRPTPPFGRIFQLLWGSGANRKVMVIVGCDRVIPADPRLTVVDTCG
jgi:hypothetical protein